MTGWTASPRRRVRPPGPRPDSLARPAGSRSSTSQPRSTLEPPSRLTDDGRRRTWHSIEPVAWAITASGYGAPGRGGSQCNQPDRRGAAMGPPTTRSGARRVCDGQVDPNSMIVAPEVPGDEAGCSPAGGGPNGTRRPSGDSGGSSGHDEQTVVALKFCAGWEASTRCPNPNSIWRYALPGRVRRSESPALPPGSRRTPRTDPARARRSPRTRWTTARMAPLEGRAAGSAQGTRRGLPLADEPNS